MRSKGLVQVDEQRLAQIIGRFPSIIAAYLFGSAARGETDQFSDVDIAVLLESDLPKEQRWKLVGDLQNSLMSVVGQNKVDVVDLGTVPLWFQREELAQLNYEEFTADPRNLAAAERWLQTSIEALVDISRHLVRRLRLPMPEEYRQIPKALADAGCLPSDDVPTCEAMISFRNRLVHRYPEVEPKEVYRIVTQGLGNIRRWRNQLVKALRQTSGAQ